MSPVARGKRIVFVAANASIDRLHEVDRLEVGAIHRPDRVVALPGGKGLNAARAAAALGAEVAVVAIVGGRAGDWIADRLAAIGIAASFVRTDGETRTCLSILDRSTGMLTEFYEPGEPVEAGTWTRLEGALSREIDASDVGAVAVSGSLPPGAPADGYARIVRLAAGRDVLTFVDSHGPALGLAIGEHPSVVKVNAAEAGSAVGRELVGPDDAVKAARTIVAGGAGAAVVTLGAAGAVIVDGQATWHLRGPATRGRYPVGSGDAFLAGLAAAIVGGANLIDAARQGMAAGIANAMTPGAGALDPGAAHRVLSELASEELVR